MNLDCRTAQSLIKHIVDDPALNFNVTSEGGRCVCWIYGLSQNSYRVQRIRDELESRNYYTTVPKEVRLPSGQVALVFSFSTSVQSLFGVVPEHAEKPIDCQ